MSGILADIDFEVPSWAGKPPNGLHLDVLKGDKLIQKLLIDEKRCYFFGRNPKLCDFTIDHASCSRVHSVLMYHKFLDRIFLLDLGSTHGTFIGNFRLEGHKPQQLQPDVRFSFGASSRGYILREKPQSAAPPPKDSDDSLTMEQKVSAKLLGLPEKEEELDNLTEYNTAGNRRIASIGLNEEEYGSLPRKRKTLHVSFTEDEQVINPEDIDPSVGRFRNLVQTAVIPKKRQKMDTGLVSEESHIDATNAFHHGSGSHLAGGGTPGSSVVGDSHPNPHTAGIGGSNVGSVAASSSTLAGFGPMSAQLGLRLPNAAPDVDLYAGLAVGEPPAEAAVGMEPMTDPAAVAGGGGMHPPPVPSGGGVQLVVKGSAKQSAAAEDEPRKKKYVKEAWPGRKPGHLLV